MRQFWRFLPYFYAFYVITACVWPDAVRADVAETKAWQSEFNSALGDHLRGKKAFPTDVHQRGVKLGEKRLRERQAENERIFSRRKPATQSTGKGSSSPINGETSSGTAQSVVKSPGRRTKISDTPSKPDTVIDGAQFPKELSY